MEYLINPKMHSDKAAIAFSGLLGGLAGAQIFTYTSVQNIYIAGLYWTAFGLMTGLFSGWVLRRLYNKHKK